VLITNQTRDGDELAEPGPVASYNGPRVVPDLFRDDALEHEFDVLLIPGGMGLRWLLDPDEIDDRDALFDWLIAMDERVQIVASVCTGSALLAAAGLLDGKPATSNQESFAWVATFGPRVLWDNVSRYVDAGKYVTSAGVSAGIDMAFHLVERLCGRAVAEIAAKTAEYPWQRQA